MNIRFRCFLITGSLFSAVSCFYCDFSTILDHSLNWEPEWIFASCHSLCSFALKRHHDHSSSIKENIQLEWPTVQRFSLLSLWKEAWCHAGRHGDRNIAERSTSGTRFVSSRKKKTLGLAWAFETSKITPSDRYPPTKPYFKKCYCLVTKHSKFWTYGASLIQTTTLPEVDFVRVFYHISSKGTMTKANTRTVHSDPPSSVSLMPLLVPMSPSKLPGT